MVLSADTVMPRPFSPSTLISKFLRLVRVLFSASGRDDFGVGILGFLGNLLEEEK